MTKADLHLRVTRFESDEDFLAELDERTKPLDADA